MKQRTAKWDNLKFFLILCVVTGHFMMRMSDQPNARRVMLFIYLFHMPAFIFLSGMMSKTTIAMRRYDRMLGYLSAFFWIKVILFLIKIIGSKKFELNLLDMGDISWYAFVLFIYCLLTVFLERFRPAWVIGMAVLLALLSGYDASIGSWLSAARLINYYPIFLCGYYIDPERLISFTKRLPVRIGSIVIIGAAAGIVFMKIDKIWWLLAVLRGRFPYAEFEHLSQQGALLRLCWYIGAGLLILAWIALMPDRKCIFSEWGSRTLVVYVLHYIPLTVFFRGLHGKDLAIQSGHCTLVLAGAAIFTTILLSLKPFAVINKIIIPPARKEKMRSSL
ncbi:MAG: hypothetical protein IJI10_11080 [Eubacterium sp.]|nr:hypothetical protein [Eubacterium sp.]